MPPFVPLLDGAQVEIGYSLFGKVVENRLWFVDRTPPITDDQLQALADGVASWHLAEITPHLGSNIEVLSVIAEKWDDHQGDTFKQSFINTFGGASSVCHSANVAVRVRFKGSTDQTFPDNSNFVPGIPRDAVDENTIVGSFKSALFDAYVDLIDLAASFGPFPAWRWVITSRQLAYNWRVTQAFARTDFISIPSPYISPRRRRLP